MIFSLIMVVLVVAIMIGFNALYVAGEFATVSARKTRIIQMAEGGNRLAKTLLGVLQDSHRLDNYIAASQVGITLSSLVLGIYGQNTISTMIEPWIARLPLEQLPTQLAGETAAATISAVIVLLFLTTLQVVFGELVPKSVALRFPERLALATVLPMRWSADIILRPLIILLNGSGRFILRLMGVRSDGHHAHVHSPEEIVILVKESHQGGLLDADERYMLRSVFQASERKVREVAVPHNRIVAAQVDRTMEEVLKIAAESAFTRIPIYEDDIDHILGFVHLKDLFRQASENPGAKLRDILRPVPFVPETLTILQVWNRLNQENSYLAVVFDEYGGVSGLVTREDLIEELFGELQDEFDQELALIQLESEGRLVVRGDMRLDRLNELLDLQLPEDQYNTIGGLVLGELERAPQVGDSLELEDIRIEVEAVVGASVNAVCLVLPPEKQDVDINEVLS